MTAVFSLSAAKRRSAEQEWADLYWLAKAAEILASLSDDVKVGNVSLDFRANELASGEWCTPQILILETTGSDGLEIIWDSPASLDTMYEIASEPLPAIPSTILFAGDKMVIEDIKINSSDDPALNLIDATQASGRVKILRISGSIEYHPENIVYIHKSSIAAGHHIIDPSFGKMSRRLDRIRTHLERNNLDHNSSLYRAYFDAAHYYKILCEISLSGDVWRIDSRSKSIGDIEKLERLDALPEAAMAFGYALAVAEAEVTVRPALRTRTLKAREGGAIRAKQQLELADKWRSLAMEEAKRLDNRTQLLPRSAMAMRIVAFLEPRFTVGHATIEAWLKDIVERPNGPIRSRSRSAKSAS